MFYTFTSKIENAIEQKLNTLLLSILINPITQNSRKF